jgi:polysaccharide biosynthesis transport protein
MTRMQVRSLTRADDGRMAIDREPVPPTGPQFLDLVAVLWRRKLTVAAVTILVIAIALLLTNQQTPLYRSEAKVLVLPTGPDVTSFVDINLETEEGLVDSSAVAALVAEELQLNGDTEELLDSLEVSVDGNSEILVIAYVDQDRTVARSRAQSFAESYLDFKRRQSQQLLRNQTRRVEEQIQSLSRDIAALDEEIVATTDPVLRQTLSGRQAAQTARLGVLQQQLGDLQSNAALSDPGMIVQPASLPSDPANENYLRNGFLALVLGLILGLGLAFLRERLDDRIRDIEDLEAHLGAPGLAVIPRRKRFRVGRRSRPVTLAAPTSPAAEAYRRFCTGFLFASDERAARVVMIASPGGESGKAATAVNLSVALAEAGKRVVLVSADLRSAPAAEKTEGPGLVDVLSGTNTLDEALRLSSIRNLELLGAGAAPSNPTEILHSKKTASLFRELASSMDFVVIESAPALPVADSLVLGAVVDGVVLVARANETRRDAVAKSREQFMRSGAQVLGGVLEGARPETARLNSRRGRRSWVDSQLTARHSHAR